MVPCELCGRVAILRAPPLPFPACMPPPPRRRQTNCCVESSMRTAYEKGYHVITLTDCCAATRWARASRRRAVGASMASDPTWCEH